MTIPDKCCSEQPFKELKPFPKLIEQNSPVQTCPHMFWSSHDPNVGASPCSRTANIHSSSTQKNNCSHLLLLYLLSAVTRLYLAKQPGLWPDVSAGANRNFVGKVIKRHLDLYEINHLRLFHCFTPLDDFIKPIFAG
jgi:hypothetical protein